MKASTTRVFKFAVLATLALSTGLVRASDLTRPLPDFELKKLDGRIARSRQSTMQGKWLLIYVEAGCKPCEDVLRVFDRDDAPADLKQKVVVVVGRRSAEDARRLAARFPQVPENCWYADSSRVAATALRAKGAPVIYGLRDGRIEWSLSGALGDQKKLQSILLTWSER